MTEAVQSVFDEVAVVVANELGLSYDEVEPQTNLRTFAFGPYEEGALLCSLEKAFNLEHGTLYPDPTNPPPQAALSVEDLATEVESAIPTAL